MAGLAPSLLLLLLLLVVVVVVGVPRLLLWHAHGAGLSEVRVHCKAMLLPHQQPLWREVLMLHLSSVSKHGPPPLHVRLLIGLCKAVQLCGATLHWIHDHSTGLQAAIVLTHHS